MYQETVGSQSGIKKKLSNNPQGELTLSNTLFNYIFYRYYDQCSAVAQYQTTPVNVLPS